MPNSDSAVVILLARLELVDVNEPLTLAADKFLITAAFVPSEPLIPAAVNEPPPPVPNPAVAAEALTAVSQLTPPFMMCPNEPVEVIELLIFPVAVKVVTLVIALELKFKVVVAV